MLTALKTFGRLAILLSLVGLGLGITMLVEIVIDQLTYQSRDMRHLLKHSLGNLGSFFVIVSIAAYMAKKKYRGFPGKAKDWLNAHEALSVLGVALVGMHTGAHFGAILPLVTFALTVACLISGFVGMRIYNKARRDLTERKNELLKSGASPDEAEETLALATATANTLARWRNTHRPLSLALGLALLWHVVVALFFGG
ncbi:MAG: hypothetical protein OEV92_06595 [Nitrospinota bacterium]|nr:hypothetical protein [Nitrospinota bacterium]